MKEILLILNLGLLSYSLYCSSSCIDYVDVCTGDSPQQCTVCNSNIFKMQSSNTGCITKQQTVVVYQELIPNNMNLSTYASSSKSIYHCQNYTLSGKYGNQDYLYKNYTLFPQNHYMLQLIFQIAFLGNWSKSDQILLAVDTEIKQEQNLFNYSCNNTEFLCDSFDGCIRPFKLNISHNSKWLALNISSLSEESDSSVQGWGVKDILIAAYLCNPSCLTCQGQSQFECTSCPQGTFLLGNTCVDKCPNLHLVVHRQCVNFCPAAYYSSLDDMTCQPCAPNCAACIDYFTCSLYTDDFYGKTNSLNTPSENMSAMNIALWTLVILLILIVGIIIAYKLYKFLNKNKDDKNTNSQSNNKRQQDNKYTSQLWVSDDEPDNMEAIEPIKLNVQRKRKRRNRISQKSNIRLKQQV